MHKAGLRKNLELQIWKGAVATLRLARPLSARLSKGDGMASLKQRAKAYQVKFSHAIAVWALGATLGYLWFAG